MRATTNHHVNGTNSSPFPFRLVPAGGKVNDTYRRWTVSEFDRLEQGHQRPVNQIAAEPAGH